MRNRERNRADAVASFREEVIDAMATLGGEFDSRIKKLKELKRKLDEREETIGTLEHAKEIEAEATQRAAAVQEEANAMLLKAQEQLKAAVEEWKNLRVFANQLAAKDGELKSKEEKLRLAQEAWESKQTTELAYGERKLAELTERESVLAAREADVNDAKQKLEDRLEALRVV